MSTWREIGRNLTAPPAAKAVLPQPVAETSNPAIFSEGASARLAKASWRRHLEAYGGKDAIGHVMECVDLIAQTASSADYSFKKGQRELIAERNDKTPSYIREAPQDLVRLIRYPNPWQDWAEFIELTVIDFLLVGNSFWLKSGAADDPEGKPSSLIRLDPRRVNVIAGDRKMINHYEVEVQGQHEDLKYTPEQIVHFRRPNPHSDQVGLGVIAGDPRMFDIELAMTESMASYYEQGMRVSGVLESDRTVPQPIMDKIKRQFAGLYGGARNSYKVPVLERGLKFKATSGSAAEAEFKHLAPMSREQIAGMFKVPLPLLGTYDNADRQAVREAQRIFDNKVMVPFLRRMGSRISHQLTLAWMIDFQFDYEYVMPIEERVELVEKLGSVPGFRVREVRELAGYDPLGPDVKGPDGKPVDEYVLNLPGEDDNDSDVKDRQNPRGGRPPLPEHTRRLDAARSSDAEVVSS